MKTQIISTMIFVAAILYSCGKTDQRASLRLSKKNHVIEISTIQPDNLATSGSKRNDNNHFEIVKDDFVTIIEPKDEGIQSPAPQFDVPIEHYQIDAATGGTFTYAKTGSTVTIPPDALEDENGTAVTGIIDLEYREFHTQKEIFFSGIPMYYDINGERQYFESAGMLEINATQKKKKLRVKKNKQINFKMSTDNTNDEVMLYELDPSKKEWTEISKPRVIQSNIGTVQKKYWGPVYKAEKQKVNKRGTIDFSIEKFKVKKNPVTKKHEKYLTFKLYVPTNRSTKTKKNNDKYKAARIFNSVSFTVAGYNKKEFKKLLATVGYNSGDYWSYLNQRTEVYITEVQSPDVINLRFRYYQDEFNFDVTLDYNRVISEKMKDKYYDQIVNFAINEFDGRMYPHDEMVNVVDHYDSIPVPAEYYTKSLVQREFSSKNFGILNCDQPKKLPEGMVANAEFKINGKDFNPYDVTLVDFKKNCMFTYYQAKFGHFQFNPDAKNFIFGVTPNGDVAYMLPDEFRKIQTNGQMTIHLHLVKVEEFNQIMEDLFPTKGQNSYETLI